MGVSRQTVYKWEADLSVPEIDKIKAIAEYFGVSCEELLNDSIPLSENRQNPKKSTDTSVQNENIQNNTQSFKAQRKKLTNKKLILIIAVSLAIILLSLTLILIFNNNDDLPSNDDTPIHSCIAPKYKINRVIEEPTCSANGKNELICTQCGYLTEKYVLKKSHMYENDECLLCGKINSSAGIQYAIDESTKTAYVKSVGALTSSEVVIDKEFNGYKVTKIASHAFEKAPIVSVRIPDTVTEIEDYAFYYCRGLQKIVFSKSLYKIGKYAFSYCGKIKQLILPDSIQMIWNNAFEYTEIERVLMGKNIKLIGANAFYKCEINYFEFTSQDNWILTYSPRNETKEIEIVPFKNLHSSIKEYENWNWIKQE